jgi:hypothetical protein
LALFALCKCVELSVNQKKALQRCAGAVQHYYVGECSMLDMDLEPLDQAAAERMVCGTAECSPCAPQVADLILCFEDEDRRECTVCIQRITAMQLCALQNNCP